MTTPHGTGERHVPLVAPDAPGAGYADLPGGAPPPAHRAATAPRRHRTPLAWLPWALLAGIALLLLLGLLLAALASGDSATDSSRDGSKSGASSAAAGSLTAGGADVLKSTGALRGHVGQPAVGKGVHVQSVVSDEGFWVGSSTADRVFVHLAPSSRDGRAESPYQVRAGDSVDLTGKVARSTASTAKAFGVTTTEGARQLQSEGAYVEATRVSLAS